MRKVLDYILALPLIVCVGIYLVILAIFALITEIIAGTPPRDWFKELSRGPVANGVVYRHHGLHR